MCRASSQSLLDHDLRSNIHKTRGEPTDFSVKNYKCLADVSLPLTPIHVIIGKNDTGKTSLTQAIHAAFKLFHPSFPASRYNNSTEHNTDRLCRVFIGDHAGKELLGSDPKKLVQLVGTIDKQDGVRSPFSIQVTFLDHNFLRCRSRLAKR
jgi:AAA ATPase domain